LVATPGFKCGKNFRPTWNHAMDMDAAEIETGLSDPINERQVGVPARKNIAKHPLSSSARVLPLRPAGGFVEKSP
jgi:hypothetical protein